MVPSLTFSLLYRVLVSFSFSFLYASLIPTSQCYSHSQFSVLVSFSSLYTGLTPIFSVDASLILISLQGANLILYIEALVSSLYFLLFFYAFFRVLVSSGW